MVNSSTSIACFCFVSIILVSSIHPSIQLAPIRNQNSAHGFDGTSSRRDWIRSSILATASTVSTVGVSPSIGTAVNQVETSGSSSRPPKLSSEYYDKPYTTKPEAGRYYFPTLTPPFNGRATYRYDLGRHSWALEQLLTFANVTATIRCNVIQLESTGGLWVHSPQWPTGEFCELLNECGIVEHVVLPCNAFEHKAPMEAFISKYPNVQVWVAPGQYGPLGSCGTKLGSKTPKLSLPYRVDGILGDDDDDDGSKSRRPPWLDEFDMAVLYVDLPRNAGPVSEVAFCHRPTKTLISTDAVVYIPTSPPDILSTYFDDTTIQNDATFWPKSVLQSVFLPLRGESSTSNLEEVRYPGYEALSGRLVRAPILRAVVDARAPDAVRNWILQQTDGTWNYDRIISSHFASPVEASPADVKNCFEYLFDDDIAMLQRSKNLPPITCGDWELLDSINKFIAKTNAGEPAIFPFQRGCIE